MNIFFYYMIKIFVLILFFNIVYGFYYPDIEKCGEKLCNWSNKCDKDYECINCKFPNKIPNQKYIEIAPRCVLKGLFNNTEKEITGY